MSDPRHRCPVCETLSLATREIEGAVHLDCPSCQVGSVFRDARGGYECTDCSQRFLIHQPHPHDPYGGPEHAGGPLRWWQLPLSPVGAAAALGGVVLLLWLVPAGYWSLLFLAMLVLERLVRRRR